jgi:hypothetical protein
MNGQNSAGTSDSRLSRGQNKTGQVANSGKEYLYSDQADGGNGMMAET